MYKKTVESYGIDFTQMHPAYTVDTEREYVAKEKIQDMEPITEYITEDPTVITEDPIVEYIPETPATEDTTEYIPATVEDAPVTVTKTTSRKKSKK